MASNTTRRSFLASAPIVATSALASAMLATRRATAARDLSRWIAAPPPGFTPLSLPGTVVKVTRGTDFASLMQPNQLWPRPEVARAMVERALTELTSTSTAADAMRKLVHPEDVVAVKVNGIAGQKGATMAVNYEVVLPVVEAIVAAGVPPARVTVFEQYPSYLRGTRVGLPGNPLPVGVKTGVHGNADATMPEVTIYAPVKTRFVRFVTDATAIIDMTMIKDHSLSGFTGAMKNMTHGQIVNPQDHHAYRCIPQITALYDHPVLRSRVRLHLADAFKIIYDGGPLDRNPDRRIPHGAIYAATDPVALDKVGWGVVDAARKVNGLPTLAQSKREPAYIHAAAELGLGVADENRLKLREISL